MRRSKWKLPYISFVFFSRKFSKSERFFTTKRKTSMSPIFVDKRIGIHSGSVFKSFLIYKDMKDPANKLGDFSLTKIFGRRIAQSMALKAKRKKEDKKKKKK